MKNSLQNADPLLAAEWHPELNGELTPTDVSSGSNMKVWWLGKCGHEWSAVISSRTVQKTNCPYCAGRKILLGFNDLKSQNPDVAALWHPKMNGELTPTQVTSGSNKKVWWLCSQGHAFDDSPGHRVSATYPCPVCTNKRCLTGVNDVATLHPHLLEEWDAEKNGDLSLSTLVPGSPRVAWWKCPIGHTWQAPIRQRAQKQTKCLYCSGQRVLKGFNDLASQLPALAAEWHPTKNGQITPELVHSGAGMRVWWQCCKGHEWEASVSDRKTRTFGCPYCSGRHSVIGETDLGTTHPIIAAEWHPTKNGDLLPSMISTGASIHIWWLGDCGHEWKTYAYNRKAGKGCPKCSSNTSKAELDIFEYVKSLLPGIEVKHGSKRIIANKQLDIYVPSKKIAIEFNGVYWHSENRGKDKNYHYDKWKACKEEGIQLLQIWEDEWIRNPDQVKRMIAHKLGVSSAQKVFARKTVIHRLTGNECSSFLNDNHIQGFASGSYYLGLKDSATNELVAVLVLKKEPNTKGEVLNIIRYATSVTVIGGFTKLLAHAARTYCPKSFITFSDHCVSDGSLYKNNGFIADKELPPDYMYVVRGQRKHKFNYRLAKFKNNATLNWKEGLTERELAELNGLSRIWDAGKTRWVKIL